MLNADIQINKKPKKKNGECPLTKRLAAITLPNNGKKTRQSMKIGMANDVIAPIIIFPY